jgi:hypothetical protein
MGNGQRRGKLLKRAGLVILMGACAMLMSASQAKAIVIDHFENIFSHKLVVTGNATHDCVTTSPITNDLAGTTTRMADLTWTGVTKSDDLEAAAAVILSPHFLSYSDETQTTSTLILHYDFSSVVDFTGSPQFILNVDTDLGGKSSLTIRDSGTGDDTSANLLKVGASTYVFLASDFSKVNLAAVDEMELIFNGPAAFDASIDSFEAGQVPEPLTMLGMVFGLGSVGAYIRKRRMA